MFSYVMYIEKSRFFYEKEKSELIKYMFFMTYVIMYRVFQNHWPKIDDKIVLNSLYAKMQLITLYILEGLTDTIMFRGRFALNIFLWIFLNIYIFWHNVIMYRVLQNHWRQNHFGHQNLERYTYSLAVSVCTHTRQVENQRYSRTDRVQKNHLNIIINVTPCTLTEAERER